MEQMSEYRVIIGYLMNLFITLPSQMIIGQIPTMVDEIIDHVTRSWCLDAIDRFIDSVMCCLIRAIPLGYRDSGVRLIWPWNKDGSYSVKNGYHWTMANISGVQSMLPHNSHQVDKHVWRAIWKLKVIPKIKLFFWRALSDALPTLHNLFLWDTKDNLICAFTMG